jgi:thioredoxin-dependent peroxiredoxin
MLPGVVSLAVCLGLGQATLQAAVPELEVESPLDGQKFRQSDALGKFLAIHFLLKTECPYCLKHVRDYVKSAATQPDLIHLFLKPDEPDEIKAWAAKAQSELPDAKLTIYRDPEAKWAKAWQIPFGYAFHGQTVHYPALVLLDPEGNEVFRHVGKNNSDRFAFPQLLMKITELKQQAALISQHYNIGAGKVALEGYDPVAYQRQNQAVKGRKEIAATHRGVTYWFASDQNRQLFREHPEKFLPTYGGWCATAMAKGQKVEIDPTNFKVTNGRLFLFFKAFYANALKEWNKDEANLTARADAHWKQISGETPQRLTAQP